MELCFFDGRLQKDHSAVVAWHIRVPTFPDLRERFCEGALRPPTPGAGNAAGAEALAEMLSVLCGALHERLGHAGAWGHGPACPARERKRGAEPALF